MYRLKIESYTHSYDLDNYQTDLVIQAFENEAKRCRKESDAKTLTELAKGIWRGRKDYQDDKSH